MSFKLPGASEKAEYVHRQFERIANRYDLTNDVISLGMHRSWKWQAVEALGLKTHNSYLDVCCGTGDLALVIAKRLSERGRITGVDFSANMLAVAQQRGRRATRSGLVHCQLEWKQGDALDLPFAENTFHGAVISFGLRNLTDLVAGLKQMARVVKPGGHVVNLDLGHPTLPLFAPMFLSYFRHVVPVIGSILQNDRQAYTYLPESLNTYPKPEELTEMFIKAGLTEVKWRPLALGSVALHVGTVV
jgi:demethylmenaquinone methyltransferase/2-methoxy-6-polyprenyl-1,4-benzoquinol methylase